MHIIEQRTSEAGNLAQLGNYAIVYGLLLALANFALLCIVSMLGVSLDGDFGAVDIARILFRTMGMCSVLLCLYAWQIMSGMPPGRRLLAGAQFIFVALMFFALSLNYGDLVPTLTAFLRWLGTDCTICRPLPIP